MTAPPAQPAVLVVWGDSIAASGWPALMERSLNLVCNPGRPVQVVNSGKGGYPAARAKGEFAESVLAHRPERVLIQFGLNDQRFDGSRGPLPLSTPAEFRGHLAEMIRRCRVEAGADVLVLGNHRTHVRLTLPSGQPYDEAVETYKREAAAAAAAEGAGFLDMAEALRHPDYSYLKILADDGVHLSEFGKNLYGRVAANAVRSSLHWGGRSL